jgi:glycosyltransferase involved in cell wall biosynthesis
MRIGFVTGEYPPMQGGVGAFTRELAAAMTAQGHEVHIFTDERAKHSSEPSIQVTGMVRDWNWGSLVQARRWAQANRLDMINIQYQAAAFRMAPFVHLLPSRLNGFPIVTTFHDLLVPYLFPKAGPLRYQAVLTLARSSDGVIVTNREDRNRLSTERGIVRLKHVPIGSNIPLNPLPDYVRDEWRARMGIPPEGILAGYFGFLNANKGIETLLRGVAEACQAGLDLYLVMIGGRVGSSDATNLKYAEQIDDLIGELNIQSRLIWTGFVNDAEVSAHLLACDFLILPFKDGVSFRRGSFMAGLAHGCAIITTRPAADLPELRDGLNVRLIPPESPAALCAAIESLSENIALREQLQANARTLSQQFNWQHIAAETVGFYQEIIESAIART